MVVLMHGIRANRIAMERRAVVLSQHGFGVLLFDFQAHGESIGRHITFGYLEGMDAEAAVAFAKDRFPKERVGVIGASLGGAAALLGPKPLPVDALVLESVFADIKSALANRLYVRLGPILSDLTTPVVEPLFAMLMPSILGVRMDALQPVDRIGSVTAPVLIASGTLDPYTPLTEARSLFDHAREPKIFWAVKGATHVDLEHYAQAAYWDHVLPFLTKNLR